MSVRSDDPAVPRRTPTGTIKRTLPPQASMSASLAEESHFPEPETEYDVLLKVVLVGDSEVGKSCLLKRFTRGEFLDSSMTIGVDFESQTFKIESTIVKVQIWDTAGQERFRSVTKTYYNKSNAFVICFDITNKASFENVKRWMTEVEGFLDEFTVVVLVGCKSDLSADRKVSEDEARKFADTSALLSYIETSAKVNDNVEALFIQIAHTILLKRNIIKGSSNTAKHEEMKLDPIEVTQIIPKAKSSSCCS